MERYEKLQLLLKHPGQFPEGTRLYLGESLGSPVHEGARVVAGAIVFTPRCLPVPVEVNARTAEETIGIPILAPQPVVCVGELVAIWVYHRSNDEADVLQEHLSCVGELLGQISRHRRTNPLTGMGSCRVGRKISERLFVPGGGSERMFMLGCRLLALVIVSCRGTLLSPAGTDYWLSMDEAPAGVVCCLQQRKVTNSSRKMLLAFAEEGSWFLQRGDYLFLQVHITGFCKGRLLAPLYYHRWVTDSYMG